ncbi:MAG TPA: glycine--tRNA ligase subunit beta [Syntrophales bacterium]|nr:glycine--tRNA ligase subunit beta [Syntrophales bacterium]HPI56747.1 glycine--tRNA ligase subunit beta [Syntrophales bacterium]HPN24828.1 glycine--tRNA ligase subunit beta [Syntrophales bacterium]HQM30263.1 glycine--tRNA ligase subunit beta [Syntrophales bacterium]
MSKELLFEIGTEEIPAEFLPRTLKDMEEIIRKEFAGLRIGHGEIKTLATPRRLVLFVHNVASRQEDQVIEKIGPAKKAAFDDKGNPTPAALGFARGQGLDIAELKTVTTEKGEYLLARKKTKGGETKDLLPALFTRFITSIPFPKSMRWMNLDIRFVRPIHWIVALFGGEVVPFRVENITSGDRTRGHRFMHPRPFKVRSIKDYLAKTRKAFVIVDPEERRKIILEEAEQAAAGLGGRILRDDELLEEVTFLVEYPSAVVGNFEEDYLKLPKDVLTATMMDHQRYFPVIDGAGKLLSHFVTINNTIARDPSVVARGNEKVIRARLADAKFFFEADQKIPLNQHFEKLRKVVFHSMLGTSYDKVMRFRELAAYITKRINPGLKDTVDRTACLAKADIETQMIYEFPELQGIMGREYALIQGENPVVAKAIYEHYLPTQAGGELPETDEGAIVSIADKIDSIVGFFGANQMPTGTADPYGLRRQALGILNIILHKKYRLDLPDLIDRSMAILGDKLRRSPAETKKDVLDFFRGRLENQLISQGHPYDVVDAVLAVGISDIGKAMVKIGAVEDIKGHPDFQPLAIAFKRVVNILKGFKGGSVDPTLFETDVERDLYEAWMGLEAKIEDFLEKGEYREALAHLVQFRKPVDSFFEGVLVMAKDEKVRINRLSLLEAIARLFYRVADFSKIVTEK